MPTLTPCPTLLQDPAEHDFRQPDLAWVGDEDFREELAEANFGNYAAEIWIGPRATAADFAQALSDEYEKWATALHAKHPDRPASDASTAVLYWENTALDLAAVAVVPRTDLSTSPDRVRPRPIPARDAYPDMIALPGSEAISPFEMVEDVEASQEDLEEMGLANAVAFIRSITTATYLDELDGLIEDLLPDLPAPFHPTAPSPRP